MSGEAGGALVGGIVLLTAIPIVVAGVAIAGMAVGTVALGSAAVKAALNRKDGRKIQVGSIAPAHCSLELQNTYEKLRATLDEQDRRSSAYYAGLERETQALAERLRRLSAEGADPAGAEKLIRDAREENEKMLGSARAAAMEAIHRETAAETGRIMSTLEQAQKSRMDLVDWKKTTEAARAQQGLVARDLLRDAKATVELLRSMAEAAGDESFSQRVQVVEKSCQTGEKALADGSFMAAAAEGQRVVSRGTALVLEQMQNQAEDEEIRIALEARLEGLKAELNAQEVICFDDEIYGPRQEPMNDFTQGAFGDMQKRIQCLLDELHSSAGQSRSGAVLQESLKAVENELVPQVEAVIRMGRERMLGYYERLHALQVISDYMQGQGYRTEWVQPVAGDPTQKLVVQFVEPTNGNSMSVSLDEDVTAEDLERMAMEIHCYYSSGFPVTEKEKASFRDGMMRALQEKGLSGSLECTGSVGAPAADRSLETAESVQRLPQRQLFTDA